MPSKSSSQHRLMAAVAHNPAFAKKVGIPAKVGKEFVRADKKKMADGGTVNAAGNYTKPEVRKRIVSQVKSEATQGTAAGQWSARKAQLVAKRYKEAGGGYKD
tara:strand:+ start:1029 stop:1337 length:309 start_codon:yes stop_codon:yes gene_type:complete